MSNLENQSSPGSDASEAAADSAGPSPAPTSAPARTSTTATTGKKKNSPPTPTTVERVGQPYRLTQPLDWGVRFACLMLEQEDGTRRTQQDFVDEAVRAHLDRLRKKGMAFPDKMLE
ncbi:hypothetical protein LGH70_22990 [Hymenobacter sp. BT635]|uniref:CopG family transcriptional regulator n=1 Tax=Hymenobacter nitidus TaxID=2880929 RepID=A0ABS8AJ63_9BACT|nr:hypothetical protein [Hymenobacter nitidus]MCB2380478.1 hypothetical protein [Hymenobacter nitidus]